MLSHQEQQRKCKQNGCTPTDPIHKVCVSCGHQFIDEPNTDGELHDRQLEDMREFELKRQSAKEQATKNNTAPKRVTAPKLTQAHRQCHCHQMHCVGMGSTTGSPCPIKCRKDDGRAHGTNASDTCECPICKCPCNSHAMLRKC